MRACVVSVSVVYVHACDTFVCVTLSTCTLLHVHPFMRVACVSVFN